MERNYFLLASLIIPLAALFLNLTLPGRNEKWISRISFSAAMINFLLLLSFTVFWMMKGATTINVEELSIYRSDHYEFVIDFLFDKLTAVYLLIGAMINLLITKYSVYYMHKEEGYKRYFITVLLFYLAYNFTVLAGNFETLFVGWEILGLSSFLLIAFYRNRYLPVRNAVKVFSIYRIGDAGILLAMWASHHLWHENISFYKLGNYELVHESLGNHTTTGFFIAFCLLIAAAVKSAQLPFSSWLPRAMEGPTPSSAIFYGSLSIHFGVFLLLRTYPFWEQQLSVRMLIGVCGLTTAIIAFFIARVQSTIKAQIAYASIAQLGIMFVELAFGLTTIVLIHFAGNAFLRTYQLLISPSIVSYAIRDQFYHFRVKKNYHFKKQWRRIESTIYVWASMEWGLDKIVGKILFTPMKKVGRKLSFLNQANYFWINSLLLLVGCTLLLYRSAIPSVVRETLPYAFMLISLLLVLRSFTERESPLMSWNLVVFSHIWVSIAVSFNEKFSNMEFVFFLSGFLLGALIGGLVIRSLKRKESLFCDLNQYYGHVYEYPKMAFVFLLSVMMLMGFPITISFIGEDLVIRHIHENQLLLAFFYSQSYLMGGVALIRIYARLFLGPHIKTYHSTAIKSA